MAFLFPLYYACEVATHSRTKIFSVANTGAKPVVALCVCFVCLFFYLTCWFLRKLFQYFLGFFVYLPSTDACNSYLFKYNNYINKQFKLFAQSLNWLVKAQLYLYAYLNTSVDFDQLGGRGAPLSRSSPRQQWEISVWSNSSGSAPVHSSAHNITQCYAEVQGKISVFALIFLSFSQ